MIVLQESQSSSISSSWYNNDHPKQEYSKESNVFDRESKTTMTIGCQKTTQCSPEVNPLFLSIDGVEYDVSNLESIDDEFSSLEPRYYSTQTYIDPSTMESPYRFYLKDLEKLDSENDHLKVLQEFDNKKAIFHNKHDESINEVMAVGLGLSISYRNVKDVWSDIKSGKWCHKVCYSCSHEMICTTESSHIMCPSCRSVDANSGHDGDEGVHVAMGFQPEWCQTRQM